MYVFIHPSMFLPNALDNCFHSLVRFLRFSLRIDVVYRCRLLLNPLSYKPSEPQRIKK